MYNGKIIKKERNLESSSNYIVGLGNDRIVIFENRTEEYVLEMGYSIIGKAYNAPIAKAEQIKNNYIANNTIFMVVENPATGEYAIKKKVQTEAISRVPMGTIGIFKKRKEAKAFLREKKAEKQTKTA